MNTEQVQDAPEQAQDAPKQTQDTHQTRRSPKQNASEIIQNAGELAEHAASAAENIGGAFANALRERLRERRNSIMVMVDDASLEKIDALVESGILSSRSEGGAFLIAEGIQSQAPLFDKITEKVAAIHKAKMELHALLDEGPTDN